MKKPTYYLILILFCLSCKTPPERNCADYKTGTFEFTSIVNGEEMTTIFERIGKLEIDYFQGKQDSSTVRWINECEYILKRVNPKNRIEEKPIHIKILTTTDSSYTFEFNTVGETKKLRGTAFKKH
ncbi:DNA topoisomerase IV [Croceitalea rosinachiae]|uniref:DNA topoisomerase IV n=1 Tax=Croceitalea rosinachiae TaxID=3075596 RepID=A0ABU3AEG2_9FLAO|nr:DNA topoisomerase IV [Croceitalea sp. F388]MDT0607468.1 DNA topoisomerase IV [Croceitalea sp. F388]